MAPPIDFDRWSHVQPASWRLRSGEFLYAVYNDYGADDLTYIALTNKRILFGTGHELGYDQILYVERYGNEVMVRAKEGRVTLLFDGDRQANYAWKILWVLRSGK